MIKKMSREQKRNILAFVLCTLLCCIFMLEPVRIYASDGMDELNEQLSLFKELIASLISVVGSVVFMWSIFKMGLAMQHGGNAGMEAQGLSSMGGGILMIAAPQLVLLFTA